jgi:hypothetical protein
MALRPALAALAEQQKIIDQQSAAIEFLHKKESKQEIQIRQLTRGLSAVARLTGLDQQVRTAIFRRTADEQNPAQPVPDPAPEGPTQTTVDAETPEAYADVRAPGLVPGTNNDTAADAVSTAYTPGQDIASPALNQLVDVTRPIDGTQGPRPLSETKTLIDVRTGDPMNAQVAFPVNGPYANAQRTSSLEDGTTRALAAMRLAKLRIATGTAEHDDEMILTDSIAKDASLSTDTINREIATLDRVNKSASRQVDAPRNVVPRASVQRTTPNMTRTALSEAQGSDMEAETLFLGDL